MPGGQRPFIRGTPVKFPGHTLRFGARNVLLKGPSRLLADRRSAAKKAKSKV